jgi:subtilase family serine protease
MKPLGFIISAAVLIAGTSLAAGAGVLPSRAVPAAAGAPAGAPRAMTPEAFRGRILGPMASDKQIQMHVLLRGQHEDQSDRFADMQNVPGSPQFGHYLTPQEVGQYFGADPGTYQRALALLRANGFTIVRLANNRRDIIVRAPASVASTFFKTPLDLHVEGSRIFYAARYVPIIPAELNAELVTGLNDYHVMHSHMRVRPNQVISGNFSWAPADVAVAYDLNPLYAAGLTGKGITMANATSGAASPSDLALFQSTFKLPAAKLVSTPIDGALSEAGNGESTLDVDWATATARNVTFNQVVAHTTADNDFDDVYEYIADKLGATTHVVTTSWGSCEQDQDRSEQSLDNSYFKQAAMEGQWWFSASGDDGSDDCADNSTTAPSVDFPGSSPYVTSVGGTNLRASISNGNVTKYSTEYVWAYGNCAYNGEGSNGAGGGGKSHDYTKPAAQVPLTPKDGVRDVPDVSLIADDVNDGLFVAQGGRIEGGNGGTSEAAPQWAGLFAIIEQHRANYKSVVAPYQRLYKIAGFSSHATYFHDVVGANNGVPSCAVSNGFDWHTFAGYTAVTGYDLASGIGSYIAAPLVDAY